MLDVQTACTALKAKVCLQVSYGRYMRVVEVHACGYTKENRAIARVWQVRGGSVSSEPVPLAVARRRTLLIWSSSSFSPARETAISGAPGDGAINVSLPTINEPPRPRERPLVGPVLPLTNAPSPGGVSPLATPGCRLTRW